VAAKGKGHGAGGLDQEHNVHSRALHKGSVTAEVVLPHAAVLGCAVAGTGVGGTRLDDAHILEAVLGEGLPVADRVGRAPLGGREVAAKGRAAGRWGSRRIPLARAVRIATHLSRVLSARGQLAGIVRPLALRVGSAGRLAVGVAVILEAVSVGPGTALGAGEAGNLSRQTHTDRLRTLRRDSGVEGAAGSICNAGVLVGVGNASLGVAVIVGAIPLAESLVGEGVARRAGGQLGALLVAGTFAGVVLARRVRGTSALAAVLHTARRDAGTAGRIPRAVVVRLAAVICRDGSTNLRAGARERVPQATTGIGASAGGEVRAAQLRCSRQGHKGTDAQRVTTAQTIQNLGSNSGHCCAQCVGSQ